MDNSTIFIVLLPALISGLASAIIASQKGRDGFGWFFVGVLFMPIAIPFALVASPIRSNIESLKACNFCKELINQKAVKCPHCQSELKNYSEKSAKPKKDRGEIGTAQTSARDKVLTKAEELGFEVNAPEGSSRIVFKKNGKKHEFLILKRAQDFLERQ
ncbi:hypothetical protein OH214_06130 [Idiomarina abyssalis]|uniref:hypothetical protein n=1 Tax=Idiomarina abyssalis TaxID=86102 RepID=UPI002301DC8E|nr:hypothetical protein [Idiomarina abyssalis]MDA6066701.1 hypothetical protein [Idiomarina abyssalis]